MSRKKLAPIAERIIPPVIRLWIRKVSGLENLPEKGPFIICPNHSSYIEHLMLSCIIIPHLNSRIYFISKKEHFESMAQSSWHELWGKYIGYIKIDRSRGEEALKSAEEYLRKKAIIIIYPEGTRTLTGKLQKGKTGAVRLALWSKVPIIPVGIKGAFEILPKGKTIPRLKRAEISFGKPIYLDDYYRKPMTRKLLRTLTTKLMKDIAKLSGKKYRY